jgi:amidase
VSLSAPSREEVQRAASSLGIDLTDFRADNFAGLVAAVLPGYSVLDGHPERQLPVRYPRTPGYRPLPADNPYEAWYWRTSITGNSAGPLLGRKIAIKDNIPVAGVPMMCGSRLFEGHIPLIDATVVTRLLDAGAEIVGKTTCEDMCVSVASHTSVLGPVRNPLNPAHSAGGSSSGSAAAIAAGDVDLALGADQGGSIRVPSFNCGIYGLKPTHGLVPYTGAIALELSIDHIGPMASTVAGCADLLSVIAGPDGLDPRQAGIVPQDYQTHLDAGVAGLKIVLVREGFHGTDQRVDDAVTQSAQTFAAAGASVDAVSVPLHAVGSAIFFGLCFEGLLNFGFRGHGVGSGYRGYYASQTADHLAKSIRARPQDIPDSLMFLLLTGLIMEERTQGHYFTKAQNARLDLAEAYDRALKTHDLLIMPTAPILAPLLPGPEADFMERMNTVSQLGNTCPFNATGHPAMNVPCAMIGGLPVGMMLIGRRGDDATVLRAAKAFEASTSWSSCHL